MIRIKDGINLLDLLASCGFTSYELRKQHIFGEKTIQKLRRGGLPSWRELDFICTVTAYSPGEIIEYRQDKKPVTWGDYQIGTFRQEQQTEALETTERADGEALEGP